MLATVFEDPKADALLEKDGQVLAGKMRDDLTKSKGPLANARSLLL